MKRGSKGCTMEYQKGRRHKIWFGLLFSSILGHKLVANNSRLIVGVGRPADYSPDGDLVSEKVSPKKILYLHHITLLACDICKNAGQISGTFQLLFVVSFGRFVVNSKVNTNIVH